MRRRVQGQLAPLVQAGFTVWVVSRRRNMPVGHSVADMAADYAQVIAAEFGGQVDLVVGMSYGGIIAQHLAANDPQRVGHMRAATSRRLAGHLLGFADRDTGHLGPRGDHDTPPA